MAEKIASLPPFLVVLTAHDGSVAASMQPRLSEEPNAIV
jgi:hypothetical protein